MAATRVDELVEVPSEKIMQVIQNTLISIKGDQYKKRSRYRYFESLKPRILPLLKTTYKLKIFSPTFDNDLQEYLQYELSQKLDRAFDEFLSTSRDAAAADPSLQQVHVEQLAAYFNKIFDNSLVAAKKFSETGRAVGGARSRRRRAKRTSKTNKTSRKSRRRTTRRLR